MMNLQQQPPCEPVNNINMQQHWDPMYAQRQQSWDPMCAQREQSWDLDAQQPWELTPLVVDRDTLPRQEWRRWDDEWTRYADAMRLCDYPPDMQRDYFLYALGSAGRVVFDSLKLTADEKLNLALVRDRLAGHFERVLMHRRFHFNRVHQGYYLTFEEFLEKLMNLSNGCEYGDMREEMVRDRLIAGLQCRNTQNILLQEPHLTLPRAIDICRSRESKQKSKKQSFNRRAMRFNRVLNEARKEFRQYRNASAQVLLKLKSTPPIEVKDDIDVPVKSVIIKNEVDDKCIEIKDISVESKKRDSVAHINTVVIKKEPEDISEMQLTPMPRIKSEAPGKSIDDCIETLNQELGLASA